MRFLSSSTALFIGALALLSLPYETAQGCHRRYHSGPVYYSSAPVYYQSSYAAPMYYPATYSAPMHYQQRGSTLLPMPTLVGPASSTARSAATASVAAADGKFEPAQLNVPPGTTVQWTNRGKQKHTVTSDKGLWDSGDLDPGATYSRTFDSPGTYTYNCRHHKGMTGTIVVGSSGK